MQLLTAFETGTQIHCWYDLQYVSSYLNLQNQRALTILSAHRLLPSMLCRIPLLLIDTTAVPVDNSCQLKKSVFHWNVWSMTDLDGLWPHYELNTDKLLPALQRSTNLISAQFKLSRHLTGSPSRIIRMQMVNTLVVERFRTKFTLVVRSDNFFRFFLSQSTCVVSWPTFLAYSAFSLRSSASFPEDCLPACYQKQETHL